MSDIKNEFKDLLEAWDIEMIITDIDNAYERDVMLDLFRISKEFSTTIESQKEEIERHKKDSNYWNVLHSKETERADKLQKEIESLKAITELKNGEIENLRDDYGVIFYELNRLEVQLELPKRGYLRNCLENLINLSSTHAKTDYKAISDLAIKGLRQIVKGDESYHTTIFEARDWIDKIEAIADSTLSEIERLQNVAT